MSSSIFTISGIGSLIRKDLIITFEGIDTIIHYNLIVEKDLEASKFIVQRVDSISLKLKWKFFDPNDVVKIQLIYFGIPIIQPEMKGKIFGTRFKEFDTKNKLRLSLISIILWSLTSILFFILGHLWNNPDKYPNLPEVVLDLLPGLVFIIFIITAIVSIYSSINVYRIFIKFFLMSK
ncbi:MAG: hypothetical protein MUO72_11300 [Bacteroidales bacterium]|nr:hypothetical protein [Bacteroidales bacterium]